MLVYDGDCAFCRRSVGVLRRIAPGAETVAWQDADLAALGLTEEQASEAVQWVEPGGAVRSGHEAIAAALMTAGRLWALAGRLLLVPGISWVAARVYRLVADNRGKLGA